MAVSPVVSVIVVSYRSAETLPECVGRALAAELPVEVLVVDNAPGDGSLSALREALPALECTIPGVAGHWRVIECPGNPGFAVACNRAAAEAAGEWLLLLNPDCYLPPTALSALLQTAAELPSLGLLGVLLENAEGQLEPASLRRDPTPWRAVLGGLGGRRLLSRDRGGEQQDGQLQDGLHAGGVS